MAMCNSAAKPFTLLFIGGGVSTLYTVLNLVQHLSSDRSVRPTGSFDKLRIGIVERSSGGLGGVPYTRRSCYTSLLITSLRDFLPDSERALFIQWLDNNKDRIFDLQRQHGGAFSHRWAETHQEEITAGAWEELYLPRYVFGMYMDERIHCAIAKAEAAGGCEFELIHAEMTDLIREEDGFKIDLADATTLAAAYVVLAVGSAPNHAKLAPPPETYPTSVCLINDPYEPGLDCVLEQIEAFLLTISDTSPEILLVGAAASTMDVLYTLNDRWNDPRPLSFAILSPNGKLPDRLEHFPMAASFQPLALQRLRLEDEITAKDVYDAAARDIGLGESNGLTTSDTLAPISAAVAALVKRLSPGEKKEFATFWGTALGRLQRRAGPEYSNVAAELAAQGRLKVIRGRFRRITQVDSAGAHVEIEGRGEAPTLPTPVRVVINCAGFAKIADLPADHFLRRLVDRGLARPNAASTGLLVNDEMEASPGLFVLGPLLAGNVIKETPVWHVEHCGRISCLAGTLAEIVKEQIAGIARFAATEVATSPV